MQTQNCMEDDVHGFHKYGMTSISREVELVKGSGTACILNNIAEKLCNCSVTFTFVVPFGT